MIVLRCLQTDQHHSWPEHKLGHIMKKHNTVKILIGIAPQGSVAFISKGWGEQVSDRKLVY